MSGAAGTGTARKKTAEGAFKMKLSVAAAAPYLSPQAADAYAQAHQAELAQVDRHSGPGDMLGWVHTAGSAAPDVVAQIKALAGEIRREAEVFVVVGLGGSNQGARAVIDALTPQAVTPGGPQILYAALNLSAAYYQKIVDEIGSRSVYIDVIAKNFKTLEPGLAFRMLRHYLEKRYGAAEAARRIITTPTFGDEALHRLSTENGYRCLPFPENVGGRYSVFTAVGLLPIAVAGADIDALLDGAGAAERDYLTGGPLREMAKAYALTRNALLQKGYGIEVLAFFEPQLEAFGRWWRQLFGESEGKGGTALFPAVNSCTEDLHSIGQYMQQGRRQMIETFLHVSVPPCDLAVDVEPRLKDGFEYLEGKTFHEINECAYRATLKAHSEGGVPCMVLEIDALDAYHVGELLYFYFVACYYSAALLGVDPFDQPGVENYKAEMFRMLKAR